MVSVINVGEGFLTSFFYWLYISDLILVYGVLVPFNPFVTKLVFWNTGSVCCQAEYKGPLTSCFETTMYQLLSIHRPFQLSCRYKGHQEVKVILDFGHFSKTKYHSLATGQYTSTTGQSRAWS